MNLTCAVCDVPIPIGSRGFCDSHRPPGTPDSIMNRAARVRRHRAGLCIKCSQPKKDDGRKLCSPCSEFVGKAFDKSMKRVAKREACKIVHRRTVEAELENDNNSIFKGTDFMKKMGLECEMKEEEHPRQRKVPLGTPYGR